MGRKRKTRENDFTARFRDGQYDADSVDPIQALNNREKSAERKRIADTAELRAAGDADAGDALPIGRVRQVYSLYAEVDIDGRRVQCTFRKTLAQRRSGALVVGDRVRVLEQVRLDASGPSEGVVERIEPRASLLTRADSFKALVSHPIVANATAMMVVVSVTHPAPKWGLVDRMLVAASAGGLRPVIILNKIDLGAEFPAALAEAREVMAHYRGLGYAAHETSTMVADTRAILESELRGQRTVLAGHSGVGKSSLIRLVEPALDIRIGEISTVHLKGMHTTTSARTYDLLRLGAEIIDTPGVKLFGLWNVTADDLDAYFPDVAAGTAPAWRTESHARIAESLGRRVH